MKYIKRQAKIDKTHIRRESRLRIGSSMCFRMVDFPAARIRTMRVSVVEIIVNIIREKDREEIPSHRRITITILG